MHPVRPVQPNCRAVRSQWDWLRFYSGTGFSREGVRCHTAYLMVFMRASFRLKPVPLIVRVHSVRLVQADSGAERSQRSWLRSRYHNAFAILPAKNAQPINSSDSTINGHERQCR